MIGVVQLRLMEARPNDNPPDDSGCNVGADPRPDDSLDSRPRSVLQHVTVWATRRHSPGRDIKRPRPR